MPTYGVEIELHQISPFEMNLDGWQRGRDSSFRNCSEYRFNGPTNNILEAKLLVSKLYNDDNFIKYNVSHKYAGIHIHMGTTDIVKTWWKEQIILQSKCCGNLQNKVNKLIRLFRRNSRAGWCYNYMHPHNKYSPINFSTEYRTIEFRFFNSCHDKRYVCKCIDWATDLWLYIMMVYNAHNLERKVIFT